VGRAPTVVLMAAALAAGAGCRGGRSSLSAARHPDVPRAVAELATHPRAEFRGPEALLAPEDAPDEAPKKQRRETDVGVERLYAEDGRIDVGARLTTEVHVGAKLPYAAPNILPGRVAGVLAASRGVAVVVEAARLEEAGPHAWTLRSELYDDRLKREFGAGGCSSLRFRDQQALGVGTAWLAAPDVIVTAGHVVREHGLSAIRFVFGWRRDDAGKLPGPGTEVPADRVFAARELLAARLDAAGYDYAILRLDRAADAAADIQPLELRTNGRLGPDEPLYLLGCPRGLPLKYAGGARKVFEPVTWPQYGADVDAFRGNSGSPVLTGEGHEVVGMLVGGQSDHEVQGDPRCVVDVRSDTAGKGERVLRSIVLLRELQRLGVLPR
jgi:hypothetical protein